LKLIFDLKVLIRSVVIACIDAFLPAVHKLTVIVTDQASIHTSDALVDKFEE
jgi:hypothetical protein